MWVIIHPGEGRPDWEEKEFHFVPFQQNCTPNLPLETPPKLGFGASEHVGREEER